MVEGGEGILYDPSSVTHSLLSQTCGYATPTTAGIAVFPHILT